MGLNRVWPTKSDRQPKEARIWVSTQLPEGERVEGPKLPIVPFEAVETPEGIEARLERDFSAYRAATIGRNLIQSVMKGTGHEI